ncbi:hypothetical protein HAX54_030544, partial [Datura stramonium]|nr:hypothetical protein [Datura stramonium]
TLVSVGFGLLSTIVGLTSGTYILMMVFPLLVVTTMHRSLSGYCFENRSICCCNCLIEDECDSTNLPILESSSRLFKPNSVDS